MIGTRLGNWIIDKEIGRGGMSTVYLAHEYWDETPPGQQRLAAIKVLAAQLAQEPGFVDRFEREIEVLSTLQHPNIVQFLESGRYQGCYYYVMEYVEGPSFEELLQEHVQFAWDEVLEMAVQTCQALKHAHDHGIIHRDIKPPNLLLAAGGVVKLTDFGIAKVFATSRLTATNAVVGTAEYMSPEQAAGKPVTRRSDLYSLGVVLYTLLTGRPPFRATSTADMLHKHLYGRFDPPQKLVPNLPPDFDALICQLLEKDPDRRPPDALVLSRQLERIRRKVARKGQITKDVVRHGGTLIEDSDAAPQGRPGSVSFVSRLMQAELEALNRAGPIGRLLNRAWLLLLLLMATVALLVWGLWPKSAAEIMQSAEQAVAQGEWESAIGELDKLDRRYSDHPYANEVKKLRERIAAWQKVRKGTGTDLAGPLPPVGDAEHFYREGLRDYLHGDLERARERWQLVVQAFTGVPSQERWVSLAQEALTEPTKHDPVEAVLRLAKGEAPDRAEQRLRALEELYRYRRDPGSKTAHERISKALRDLESRQGDER